MTKPKKPAAKPPRPRQGGSFVRDKSTGALTRQVPAAIDNAPPPSGGQKQEG